MTLHELLASIRAENAESITIYRDGSATLNYSESRFRFLSVRDLEKNFAQKPVASAVPADTRQP